MVFYCLHTHDSPHSHLLSFSLSKGTNFSHVMNGGLPLPFLQCGVPLAALLATDKDAFRKPGTGMWDFMCDNLNGGVKPSELWAGAGRMQPLG
jgi:hypothetical protein